MLVSLHVEGATPRSVMLLSKAPKGPALTWCPSRCCLGCSRMCRCPSRGTGTHTAAPTMSQHSATLKHWALCLRVAVALCHTAPPPADCLPPLSRWTLTMAARQHQPTQFQTGSQPFHCFRYWMSSIAHQHLCSSECLTPYGQVGQAAREVAAGVFIRTRAEEDVCCVQVDWLPAIHLIGIYR